MSWWAVYETATGRLQSVGEETLAPQLRAGFEALLLPGRPDDATMWDATTKTFVARPMRVVKDILDDVDADIRANPLLSVLTLGQRQELRGILEARVREGRFYHT